MDRSAEAISAKLYNHIINNNILCPKIFIDIGANNGWLESNSYYFAYKGFETYLVEPNTNFNDILNENFKDFNFKIINCGISDTDSEGFLYFHGDRIAQNEKGSNQWMGMGNCIHKKSNTKAPIKILSFGSLIKGNDIKEIGIVSIDTEGHEEIIIKSIIESKKFPKFIIAESSLTKEYIDVLSENQYKMILSFSYNYIFEYQTN